MPKSTNRFALAAFLLGCTAMAAPANAWSLFSDGAKKTDAKDAKDPSQDAKSAAPGEALETSIREAELLRMSGAYPEAIRHLSQLMLVAADDSRIIASYGKTLAAMGRAQEAVNFLTRAQQLQPGDWTVYSALGVTYDQLGNQKDAAANYERALALKPGEPGVLSNYALSRLLAKDPDGARRLIARAEIAGGSSDPKIARNIAMVKEMAPQAASDQAFVVNTPAPSPVPHAPTVMPRTPQAVAQARPAPAAPHVSQNQPISNAAPRPLMPAVANAGMIEAAPQTQAPRDNRVVMQAVPIDPLAGPVVKLHPPSPKLAAHVEAPKPQTQVAAAPKPANQAEDLQARADAIAKTLTNKPAAIAQAKAEASKLETGKPVATNAPRPLQPAPPSTLVKTAEAPKPAPTPVKTAEAPKPAKPAPLKTADAKPKAAKDTVPALRMSANAY